MFYFVIGVVTGLFIAYLISFFIQLINKGIDIELFGYSFRIHKAVEVVRSKNKKSSKLHL